MFIQRAGYRASGEAIATHSRRRYRLLSGNPALGLPNPDPSLWLTHYSKASARDQLPAAQIPIMPHTHALIQQRRLIQSQGQLPRKEFMLHDRSNWPVIHLPAGVARAAGQGQLTGTGHRRGTSVAQEVTVEEEEDVSRGDLLDFMTPRDISRVRYEQHHDWMDEIIESPYTSSSIVPSDLGFGRKGQLEELTKDFFDAPTSAAIDTSDGPLPRVGRLPNGTADDFLRRAEDKLAVLQAELEDMRRRHARRMEKLRRSTTLTAAEKKLRSAEHLPEQRRTSKDASNGAASPISRDAVDELMTSVESDIGQKLTMTTTVTLMAKGGLEPLKAVVAPAVPAPAPASAPVAGEAQQAAKSSVDTDTAMKEPQPQPQVPPSAASTQESKPEQQDGLTSSAVPQTSEPASTTDTPEVPPAPESNKSAEEQPSQTNEGVDIPSLEDIGADVDMDGMNDPSDNADQAGEEWVMIGEEGGPNAGDVPQIPLEGEEVQTATDAAAGLADIQSTDVAQQPPTQLEQDGQLNTPDFDMGGDFDNVDVDTAGDALASYGDDEDLNLENMEGSAFGDAFHPDDEEIS
jgi:hypothetical protein